ncbi:MAG: putative Restriction modification system, type hsdS [Cytophagaceae bacterium]|jgi:type I restriction enzyme S subunit|nr:putative Restriction modification system, type hsdS [Cytophagaceae bacterium]
MKIVRIAEVCEVISGATPSRLVEAYWNGNIHWITPKDISKLSSKYINEAPEKITELGYRKSSTSLVPRNSLLLSSRAPIGLLAINTLPVCTNQGFKNLIPKKDKLDVVYLYYCLEFYREKLQSLGSGSTFKEISKRIVEDFTIPLPNLRTQKQIAEILDTADILRQKDKALIEKHNQLTQSLFLDMFGDISTNKFKFQIGTIRDLVSEVKYGTSSKSEEAGEFGYLRMNNITYEGHLYLKDLKYINLSKVDQDKYLVKKGDILFNRTNSKELVGKTAIWNTNDVMAIAGYLIRVRVNEKANPFFIWAYLNSKHGKLTLENMCKSIVGMANINAQELQDIKILLPPIEKQNKFAALIEQIKKQKQLAEESLKKSEALFNTLLQKAFKGELVKEEPEVKSTKKRQLVA